VGLFALVVSRARAAENDTRPAWWGPTDIHRLLRSGLYRAARFEASTG